MNLITGRRESIPSALLAIALALLMLASAAQAQSNPPDWWASTDNETISLAYLFPVGAWPAQADIQIAPDWFGGVTWSLEGPKPLLWVPTFLGHNGVVGFFDGQPGEAKLHLLIDNDPRRDRTKHVWYQFDVYQVQAETSVTQATESPAAFSNLTQTTVDLEYGWMRVTGSFDLVPQPGWEELTWTMAFDCTGYVAFDNVYVSTHCTAAPNVPEPATIVTLLLAFAGGGATIRHRRG